MAPVSQFHICTDNEESAGEKKGNAEKMLRAGSGQHCDQEGRDVAEQSCEKRVSSKGCTGYFRQNYLLLLFLRQSRGSLGARIVR